MFAVIGGTYREVCLSPHWDYLFGSGLRGAAAVSGFAKDIGSEVVFHTWIEEDSRVDLQLISNAFGISFVAHSRSHGIEFQYDFPMARPRQFPDPNDVKAVGDVQRISADCAMLYGMVESQPKVTANTLIYDPQAGRNALPASTRGHKANRIAVIANATEVRAMSASLQGCPQTDDLVTLGWFLREREGADVVVIKNGCQGAIVLSDIGPHTVPPFMSESIFPIGSGDVFSAVFAWWWGVKRSGPDVSAMIASAATANYCESRLLPVPSDIAMQVSSRNPAAWEASNDSRVYLAGPLYTVRDLWLLAESKRCLLEQGVRVFSPKDDVGFLGTSGDARRIAEADIKGLVNCSVVFAILDGLDAGTLFEVGYARAKNIPVIGFGERVSASDLTMLSGTGCEIFDDLSTAIYRAAWKSRG